MPELTLIDARPQEPLGQKYYQKWTLPNGSCCTTFHRLNDEYVVRFPGLADFILSKNGLNVTAYPELDISKQTIQHLYLNQIVPLSRSCQFKLTLHGSAIEIDNYSVGFIGESGRGKSTLAASFSTSGYRFLSDDGFLLEEIDSQYIVQPNHPSIRLLEDSSQALIPETIRYTPPIDYTSKSRFYSDKQMLFCKDASPLRYVYFLGEGDTDQVSITQVAGCEAVIELERHSFLLDMEDRKMLIKHFELLSALAKHPIFFRLDYPRCYEVLPDVHKAIINHAKEGVLPYKV